MTNTSTDSSPSLWRPLVVLVLFGIAFGYAEAAAVVYIRATYDAVHLRVFPERAPGELFPLATVEQWSREAPSTVTPLMEVGREFSTVLLVALVAVMASRDVRQWTASFMLAFGIWDIAYYLWLTILLGWPRSLLDWDLIFAAPLPWIGPVWAPLLVAAVMVTTGAVFFWREATGRPLQPRAVHWFAVLLAAVIIMIAFWWDARSLMSNGLPEWFNWPLLLLGLTIGIAAFLHALSTSRARTTS